MRRREMKVMTFDEYRRFNLSFLGKSDLPQVVIVSEGYSLWWAGSEEVPLPVYPMKTFETLEEAQEEAKNTKW
jgi:hypothetical protein